MFIREFKCPKCNGYTLCPNMDATLDSYMKNEFNNGSMLTVISNFPLKRPGYLIFVCVDRKCQYSERITEEEILTRLQDEWTRLAWEMTQNAITHCYEFNEYKTRYLYDEKFKKFMTDNDYKYFSPTEMYKDFLEFKENEQKKRTERLQSKKR